MARTRCALVFVVGLLMSAQALSAQDLSVYRDLHLGMTMAAVSTAIAASPSQATVVHQRPSVIQELIWRPRQVRGSSSRDTQSVQDVIFTFSDTQLFRLVVTYDRRAVEGLTDQDLIEAVSAQYGTAATPGATIRSAPLSKSYRTDTATVIARWEDEQYSVNLVRSGYDSTVGLVMFSKPLAAQARDAVAAAIRLDEQEAPQRELARQQQEDIDAEADREKARAANKPGFRP